MRSAGRPSARQRPLPDAEIDAGEVLPVEFQMPSIPIGLVTLKNRSINPTVQLFIDCARKVAKIAWKENLIFRQRACLPVAPLTPKPSVRFQRAADTGQAIIPAASTLLS